MIKYLLLFLLPFTLYASKILSYNIYDRTDRADVMITFDTPYTGTIKQSIGKSKITIKLEGASIESPKIRKVSSNFLQSLTITPMANQTQIVASVPSSIKLVASKTSDAYGLRLRFISKNSVKNSSPYAKTTQNESLTGLPTKKGNEFSSSYYIVVGILIVGIIILLYLKKRMPINSNQQAQNSWLFKSNQETAEPAQEPVPTATIDPVSIRFQKVINSTNSVVMLDFGTESYLILMGNSNILLDKFSDNKPTTQEEFETILQSRNQELEEFLGSGNSRSTSSSHEGYKEPLQAYKERAASLIYSDEA